MIGSLKYFYGFPEIASPIFAGIVDFHHEVMFFINMIIVFVFWLLGSIIFIFNEKSSYLKKNFPSDYGIPNLEIKHNPILEIVWTLIPGVILLFISIPSFALLYSIDEVVNPALTLKVIGHQWYWSYEISDYATYWLSDIAPLFDSNHQDITLNLVGDNDLTKGTYRLLETTQRLVLPIKTHIRVLITSTDVLHSWCVPSFGIKVDACPGRLNQTALYIEKLGIYYGQCSEICGSSHGFMPIVVEGTLLECYFIWTWIYFWSNIFNLDMFENSDLLN